MEIIYKTRPKIVRILQLLKQAYPDRKFEIMYDDTQNKNIIIECIYERLPRAAPILKEKRELDLEAMGLL